jgi:hypothetical protein
MTRYRGRLGPDQQEANGERTPLFEALHDGTSLSAQKERAARRPPWLEIAAALRASWWQTIKNTRSSHRS